MKSILAFAASFLILVQQPSRQFGELEGAVYRTDTNEPLAAVSISAESTAGTRTSFSVSTDNSGRYSIKAMPAGEYIVRAQRRGYLPGWGMIASPDTSFSTRVTVKPDEKISLDPMRFILAAALEGRILGTDRSGAAGLTVEVLQKWFKSDGVVQWISLSRAITDDRGRFRMFDVGPGRYYLRVFKSPSVVNGRFATTDSLTWTPMTYFPGVLNAAVAVSVNIQSGENVLPDLALPSGSAHAISGKVAKDLPTDSTPIRLVLMRRDSGSPVETQSDSLGALVLPEDGDGSFEIRNVPVGRYELFAVSRMQNPTPGPLGPNPTWIARTSLEVGDRDVQNVQLRIRPGVDVKGKLTVVGDATGFQLFQATGGGGGGIVGTMVFVSMLAADGSPLGSIRPPKIDGKNFTFDNIPEGNYSFSVTVGGIQRTSFFADIRSGARSIFGESLLIGRSDPDPIEVIVNTNGATVPVTVIGKTSRQTMVYLVPRPPHDRNPLRYRSSNVNDAGQVNVNYVAPGDYKVYAWETLQNGQLPYMDPDFLSKYGKGGVALHVIGQPAPNVEVPLVRIEP